jgi:spore coat protein H
MTTHRRFMLWLCALSGLALSARLDAAPRYAASAESDDLFKSVPRIEIEIPAKSLAVLRDYHQVWRQPRPERVDVPVTVREGGKVYTNVAIHLKGSFSFQPIGEKPSLTLNFAKFAPGQRFHGLNKIHLNNSVQDPSYICEAFARESFNDLGVPSPRASQALVKLNGRNLGMFVLIEGANTQFVKRHFDSAQGNLYDGGSGGDVTKALETDSGMNPDDRSDLTNLVRAARERVPAKRHERLREVLDVDRFITFAAVETFIVHWDGYAIGCNNYRVFHDVSRDKMVFIPHGLDQLFGVSSSPTLSITPPFKGMVAKALFSVPEARAHYLARIAELSTNELRKEYLHARVDRWAVRIRAALAGQPGELARFEQSLRGLKSRIDARTASVAQQLGEPRRPLQLETGQPLLLTGWRFKSGSTQPAASGRSMVDNREILRVIGRGDYSSGAWRKTLFLDKGRYELTGLARAEGLTADDQASTNGVILRISGVRSTEGISTASKWTPLAYEFDVLGVEDVELICEFRGGDNAAGFFDASSLRLTRRGPPSAAARLPERE